MKENYQQRPSVLNRIIFNRLILSNFKYLKVFIICYKLNHTKPNVIANKIPSLIDQLKDHIYIPKKYQN